METNIISIGNSKGVRIPKAFLKQCKLTDVVNMEVKEDKIILSPNKKPRQGWEEAILSNSEAKKEELLIPDNLPNSFDQDEWQW